MTAQTVKLPDGPGSVRGLASDASVSTFTGQVSYSIPVELPAGPGGFAPKLVLSYAGSLGNGPLGIGWGIGQVGIRRSLRLGVPKYAPDDELELFGLPGATLVPIGNGQYRAEGQGHAIRGVAVDGGFELIDPSGTRYRIGTTDASRQASGTLVSAWLLESVTDVAGHVIRYSYERNNNEMYLTAITWGPAAPNGFRAELSYEGRSDTVVSWRTGFRVAAGRRLTTIRVLAADQLRHTVALTYDQSFGLSRLATVQMFGADGTPSPMTTLSYAPAQQAQVSILNNTGGWSLGNPAISFFDVDKDGAMDLLRVESGSHRYRRNLGGGFDTEVTLRNAPALAMSSVRMLDLDGDSGAEMVARSGTTWRAYRIVDGAWVAGDWPGAGSLDLQSVALADLNGDNRMDVITPTSTGIRVWFGTADGFGASTPLPMISEGESGITPATVQFPDLNGDGLADAVSLGPTGLTAFRGRGDGRFERVGTIAYPWSGTTDTSQLRLADLDRDGLLDIVRIGSSQVFWHRGRPDGTFALQSRTLSRPAGADASTVIQLADANGNGSTDIVWSSLSGMWVIDVAGATHAGLLVGIDNGIGKAQQFTYTASTELAWSAAAVHDAWTERMPVSIAVTTKASHVLADGSLNRDSLLSVRDGIYDHAERRFIGFAESIQTFSGGTASETIRTVVQYHAGRGAERALRGQPLMVRTEDGAGNVFRQVDNQLAALAVAGLPDDPRLKRAAVIQVDATFRELGQPPATMRTRFAYDGEGRLIEERRDGVVVPGVALDGDESIHRRSYTTEDPITGVRDQVCDELVLDGSEHEIAHTQRRFGNATVIAAPCAPSNGWVREELAYFAEENRWIVMRRAAFDAHGNTIVSQGAGVERTLEYDADGMHPVSESVSPSAGRTLRWTAEWDRVKGTLRRVAAPNGTAVAMTYDGLGRLLSMAANDAPPHIRYAYDFAGPRPRTHSYTFDGDPSALGELPAVWTPASRWRHAVTVANGAGEQVLAATQLDVARWSVAELRQRDHRGRVIAISHGFELAVVDPTMAVVPADASTQTLAYDPLDRVIDQVMPTGSHRRTLYHPLGATSSVDGLAPVHTRIDGQGRTVHTERMIDGTLESVDATYDAGGRITQFRLQGGQVVHDYDYNSLGQLIAASDPDVGARTIAYDDVGRIREIQNGVGQVVTYTYDGAGRVLTLEGPGVTTRFHYDTPRTAGFERAAGQLAWVEEPTGTVELGYDAQGRQTILQRTIVDGATTIVGRETKRLSPSGLPLQIDLGDGVVLPVRYDAAGRPTQIGNDWTIEEYGAGDVPVRERFGNGVIQRFERDVLHRPTQIAIERNGSALYNVDATYNAFGSFETLTDHDSAGLDHSAVFAYDGAGRLTAATMGAAPHAYQFTYAYDGLQNLVSRTAEGPTQLAVLAGEYRYRPEAPRRLDRIVGGGQTLAQFAYDRAGRQTAHAGKQLHYDALSRVIRVDGVAGGSVTHRYGYDGTRIATRAASGATTYFVTPNVTVRGGERDHYVRSGSRLITKVTTSDALAGAQAAVAGQRRDRIALAGISLIWLAALAAVIWRACRRPSLRPLQPLRSAIAAVMALLTVTGACTPNLASQSTAVSSAIRRTYYHQTFGAGPELTTDATGALQEERRSEAFGVAIDALRDGAVGPVDYHNDPVNSLNQLSDPDTGWSDHGARWFMPETGQWASPDPPAMAPDLAFMAKPWSLNPYQYGNQNPVAYWDPDGRDMSSTLVIDPRAVAPAAAAATATAPAAAAATGGGIAAVGTVALLGTFIVGGLVVGVKLIEAGAAAGSAGVAGPMYYSDPYEAALANFSSSWIAADAQAAQAAQEQADAAAKEAAKAVADLAAQVRRATQQTVNLDTSAIIASTQLGDLPLLAQMHTYLHDKNLVMTVSAATEFINGPFDAAGPLEKAAALTFLANVQMIRDEPSARVINLPNVSNSQLVKFGLNDRQIFGTGDKRGIVTVTGDKKAVEWTERELKKIGEPPLNTWLHDKAQYSGQ